VTLWLAAIALTLIVGDASMACDTSSRIFKMSCRAAMFGQLKELKKLMKNPSYCFADDESQKTPIHYALEGR
jgi:hypothetical protein